MRRTLVLIAVLALLFVVAGCGGGKKKSAASVTPPTTAAGSTTTSAGVPKFTSAKNCQELMALGAKVSQAIQSSSGSASSIDNEVNAFKALANAAPAEIRGDFQTFAGAFAAYAQALAKAGFKPGKVPTAGQIAAMTAAAKSLSTPKLQAAEQHLSAWAQKNCGAPKTTTG